MIGIDSEHTFGDGLNEDKRSGSGRTEPCVAAGAAKHAQPNTVVRLRKVSSDGPTTIHWQPSDRPTLTTVLTTVRATWSGYRRTSTDGFPSSDGDPLSRRERPFKAVVRGSNPLGGHRSRPDMDAAHRAGPWRRLTTFLTTVSTGRVDSAFRLVKFKEQRRRLQSPFGDVQAIILERNHSLRRRFLLDTRGYLLPYA